MKRRVLAWMIATAMLLTSIPGNALTAYAQETEEGLIMEAQEQAAPASAEEALEPAEDSEDNEKQDLISEQAEDASDSSENAEDIVISEDDAPDVEEDGFLIEEDGEDADPEATAEDGLLTASDDETEDVIITWHKNINGSDEQYEDHYGTGTTIWNLLYYGNYWNNDADVSSLLPDGFYVGTPTGELVTDFSDGYEVTESVDLYLHWTEAAIITWDPQGGYWYNDDGDQTSENTTTKILAGQYLSSPFSPIYPDDTKGFAGWSMTPDGDVWLESGSSTVMPEGISELTLYAVYRSKITVTFDGGEGKYEGWDDEQGEYIYDGPSIITKEIVRGTGVILGNYTFYLDGYEIIGWEVEGNPGQTYSKYDTPSFDEPVTLKAVWGREDRIELALNSSYDEGNSSLYTDTPLTYTVIDVNTGEAPELPDGYSVRWEVQYNAEEESVDRPEFITETYNADLTELTLDADSEDFSEGYSIYVRVRLIDSKGYECGSGSSDQTIYVRKEAWILDDYGFQNGGEEKRTAGDPIYLDQEDVSICHCWSGAEDGETVYAQITSITASDPNVVKAAFDDEDDQWEIMGLSEGTSSVTITAVDNDTQEEITITFTMVVSREYYSLYLNNNVNEGNNTPTVLPGTEIEVTAQISGSYYENYENINIEDFSDITYQWSVQDENGSNYPYSEISGGINIQADEIGAYTVSCRAVKDGEPVAESTWWFNVNEQYYVLDFEAYRYDVETGERGDVIDLQNQFPVGTAAVVIPSLAQYSAEYPDGVSLEDYEFALRSWDNNVENYSFYSYSEEAGMGEPIDLPYDEYVALSGDGFVIVRNEESSFYWHLYAYEHFDPENQENYIAYQDNSIDWWNEYQYDNSGNMFFEPSYGDEDDGLMLYDGSPLTLTLRDYSDETDYSECDVVWSVEYEHDVYDEEKGESTTVYVPADEWVTWETNADQITLTAREDRPNDREAILVTAVAHKNGYFLGQTDRRVYILSPRSGLDIEEHISLERDYYVGENAWIPAQVTAYSDTATGGYEEESARITNLAVDPAESDAGAVSIRHGSDDEDWEILFKAEGRASLIATYVDPFTDEERTYSFGFLIRDNVDLYEIEINHDKDSNYILDNETVTLSYKVTAEHISGGVYTSIPQTAYRVEWSVSPEEYVTTQEDASGRLTVTTHFPEEFYNADAPELRIRASVFETDAEEGTEPEAEADESFYPRRDYYDTSYIVETASGLDNLEYLSVDETATITPVVKHYDSEHRNGEIINNELVGFFSLYYNPEFLEVKTADGSVIDPDSDDESNEKTQTPYITVKRLDRCSTDLEFSCYVRGEDDESPWEWVGSFDGYFRDMEDKVLVTLYSNGGYFDNEERKEVIRDLVDEEAMVFADDLQWPEYDGDKVFAGWAAVEDPDIEDIILPANEDDVTVPASEITALYAVWKDAITITWDPNGGKWNGTGRYGEGPTEPRKEKYAVDDNPWGEWVEKEGHALLGWSLDRDDSEHIYAEPGMRFSLPDAATTLYAQWAKGYRVTFNGNGGLTDGDYPASERSQMVPAGEPVDSYTNFYLEGKAMNGWALDAAGTQMVDIWTYKITQDTTFYVQWTSGYKVTFELGEGTLSYDNGADSFFEMFTAGSELYPRSYSYNLVPPSGMAFIGWSTKQDDESGLITNGNPLKINSDRTVYAIYAEACEVVFDANGGVFEIDGIEETTHTENCPKGGTLDNLYIPSYPDDTKILLGYSTTKDRNDLIFNWYLWNQDYLITKDQTLYAIWAPRRKVVYDGNGEMIGRMGSTDKIEYDWPEGEGYYGWQNEIIPEDLKDQFSGWSTSPSGYPLFDFDGQTVTSDMTFYAVWGEVEIPEYPVSYEFVSSSGEVIPDEALRMMRALVPGEREYVDGTQVEAVDLTGKTVDVENGHWTFASYDKDSAVIEGAPVVFTGTWSYTEETAAVEYVFVSETGEAVPAEIKALMPEYNTTAVKGTTVTPKRPSQDSLEVGDYNWTFLGYEPASAKAGGEGSTVTFTGKWKAVEKAKSIYYITYEFKVDEDINPGLDLPEEVTGLLPQKTPVVEDEAPVCAAVTKTSVALEDGNWVFGGFNTDDLPQTMAEDITLTGFWYFETKADAAGSAAGMLSEIVSGMGGDENELVDALEKSDSADVLEQLTENLKGEAGDDEDALNELLADTTTKVDDLLVDGDKITVNTGSQTVGAYVGKTEPATDAATGVKVDISGAAATVASVIRNMDTATLMENDSENYHYQAEVSIENVEDTGKKLTLDISLNVAIKETGEVVKENVEPTSPVTITLTLPEDYVGYDLTVIHTKADGSTETIRYSFISGDTQIRFTISSLSPFKLEKVPAEHVERLEPTCAKEGHIEYWKRRGKMYDAADGGNELTASDIIIPKTGAHTWDAGRVTKKATEDVTGVRTHTCKVCGAKKTAVIPKVKVKITIKSKPAKFKAKKEKKGKVTLTWKKLSKSGKKNKALYKQIKDIEIQYSTDKTFATGKVTKPLSKKKAKLKLKLKPKTTYYIRIRYRDGKGGYSPWVVKTVKTKK